MALNKRAFIGFLVALPAVAVLSWYLPAGAAPNIYAESGVAIDGTDTVAYFTEGKPVPGKREFSHEWNGTTWLFANEENRAKFAADPAAFAPQYGGYCAYAVSEGYTASTVPDAWKIVDGKLYLNYSKGVQSTWEENQSKRIVDADGNWPSVLK
ncbi:YHS domain-containing (seleno)protein [Ahrensia sp. R2A130]|uniref:YHS domain-containing (seleno)protein n=1 Tax=Ahrensia sp. R2A130 TaxID=744979 RepID=UPI0001E0E101|nr:YHS domain-containing (seleno)protein [Ahrensia sp. R2A130]EFL87987.1 YHS domain-containing protein [Ahrensia sp. R2A130]